MEKRGYLGLTVMPILRKSWEDDIMMSSGDEPDDAELTDGDSTGNGWSNVGSQFLYAQIGPFVQL